MSWASDRLKISEIRLANYRSSGISEQSHKHEEDVSNDSEQSNFNELVDRAFEEFCDDPYGVIENTRADNAKRRDQIIQQLQTQNAETPVVTTSEQPQQQQQTQTEQFHQNNVTSATNVNPVDIWNGYDVAQQQQVEATPQTQNTETPVVTTNEQPQQQQKYVSEVERITAETGNPLNVLKAINERENCKEPSFVNPLSSSTTVNAQGEIIQNNTDTSILPNIPESMINPNGNVEYPLNNQNNILERALNKVISAHPVLPDELIPLAQALSVNGVGIEKGKNIPNYDGVYEIKLLFNNEQILANSHIYADIKGSIENDGVGRIYVNEKAAINISDSVSLENMKKVCDYILSKENSFENIN